MINTNEEKQRTGQRWQQAIIGEIWNQWFEVWKMRNADLHGDTETSKTRAEREDVERTLRDIYDLRAQMEPSVQRLLCQEITDHFAKPLWFNKNWLAIHGPLVKQSIKRAKKKAIQGVRSIRQHFTTRAPVSHIELRLLGAIFYLTADASHYTISTITSISEDVRRVMFMKWNEDMNSTIKDRYICMPRNNKEYKHVVGDYTARGLPGCIGSVDCIHIAWDRCPTMYKNMFKGKEEFCSIAYEVLCNCRKFIQSVSVGHPGTRNDKHIVRKDNTVMELLEGTGWLNFKAWITSAMNGTRRIHRGVYLICDGGYLCWPCLINPYNDTIPGFPIMKWSAKLESVRKDIEGVFGILKKRFKFLKNFNVLQTQSGIDNAFVTCCIIHNIQLEHDGSLDRNLTPLPGGLEEMLAQKFGNQRGWNGLESMWVRDNDDDDDANLVHDPNVHLGSVHSITDKEMLACQ